MKSARDVIGEWGEVYRWDGGDCRKEALEDADALIIALDAEGYAIVSKASLKLIERAINQQETQVAGETK